VTTQRFWTHGRRHVLSLVVGVSLCLTPSSRDAFGTDWPQAGANAARTGCTSIAPRPPFRLAWVRAWENEVITPIAQPIVLGTTAYLGTENGRVHAVDLSSGRDRWTAEVSGAVCNALAGLRASSSETETGWIYAATADGHVTCLDAATGAVVWSAAVSRRGFTAAPLLMDRRILIGNRDGVFYCLAADTGRLLWRRNVGTPIVQSAAGAAGRVVFADLSVKVWCLDAASGRVAWTAGPLPAERCGYWPVIHRGRVIICLPELGRPFEIQKLLFWPVQYHRPVERVVFKAKSVEDMLREQEIFAEFLKRHPDHRRLFVFELSDGSEPYVPSVLRGASENGEPVVVAGDGHVYTVFRTSAAERGLINITRCALGRLDLTTGRLARPIVCGDFELAAVVGVRSPFELTSDEPVTLSAGGSLLVGMRCGEAPGAIDVVTRQTYRLPYQDVPRANDLHNAQAPPVVSGRWILTVNFNHLICVAGQSR